MPSYSGIGIILFCITNPSNIRRLNICIKGDVHSISSQS